MLQKGILFSHSHSLCMCVWDCMEGCGSSDGFQCPTLWRSTTFTPLNLTEPRVWYFSGTGWPVSSQDLPVSMPELQLSLHVGAVSSTRAHAHRASTLTHSAISKLRHRSETELWCTQSSRGHTNTCGKCSHSRMNIPGLMFNTNSRKVNPCMSGLEADTWKWPFLFLKLTVTCIAYFLHSLENNQIGINSSLTN